MRRSHLLIATLPPALLSGLLAFFWEDLAEQVGVAPTPAVTPAPLVETATTTPPEPVATPAPSVAPTVATAPTVAPTATEEPKTEEPKRPESPEEFAALLQRRGAEVSENALWLEFVRHPQALETLVSQHRSDYEIETHPEWLTIPH